MKISILILTFNEEIHIERLILNLINIFEDIIFVDSYSNDRTIEIINKYKLKNKSIRLYKNTFKSQSSQIIWSVQNIDIKNDFIFKLDADEIISNDLEIFLKNNFQNSNLLIENKGFAIKRKIFFYNKILKWGGMNDIYVNRIFNKNFYKVEDRLMDEHILIKGKIKKIKNGYILDKNLNTLDQYIKKHLDYSTNEAIEFKNKFVNNKEFKITLNVLIKKKIKYLIYYKIPPFFRSFLFFIYRYILLLGFLDGRSGLCFHIINTFFYRFITDVKIEINKKK